MELKVIAGKPQTIFPKISGIIEICSEGVWSAEDLQELLEMPHEEKILLAAFDGEKPIGYAFIVASYMETLDARVASIEELGMLPEYRDSDAISELLIHAIDFSTKKKANLLEHVVSSLELWAIPAFINKNFKQSEIKADREISTLNEARLIFQNLKKNPKLNVLINQIFFETKGELDVYMIESEAEIDDLARDDPLAFSSIIAVNSEEDNNLVLEELNNIDVEWDEIGITFEFIIDMNSK